MLRSFFFNHKMETLPDCVRWQRFLWLRQKLSLELQKQALKVLPLRCDLELLRVSLAKKENSLFFCVLLQFFSFSFTLPSLGPPAAGCAAWPCWVGTTLRVFWSTIACHLFSISNASLPAKWLQLCPALCDPVDCRFFNPGNPGPSGSFVHGFSRQEYWSVLPCPPSGDLPNPGVKPLSLMSPALAVKFFTTSATWEAPIFL